MALAAFGQLDILVIDDPHLMPRQRPPAADETQRIGTSRLGALSLAPGLERLAPDPVDQQPTANRRKGHAQGRLGQTVDRGQRRRLQPAASEALGEALQGVGADRLGAVEGQPPAAQVEALDIAVGEFAQAQLVGEVRRRRQRAAVAVDGLQPAQRPGEKG
ncbi:hypothetical protein D9M68_859430 [compost metagenome]